MKKCSHHENDGEDRKTCCVMTKNVVSTIYMNSKLHHCILGSFLQLVMPILHYCKAIKSWVYHILNTLHMLIKKSL